MQPYKLHPGAVVTLYEIDFSQCLSFKPTVSSTIRCSPYRNGNSDIVRGGNSYNYIGVRPNGFRSEMNSSAPTPTLTFDRVSLYANSAYQALVNDYQNQMNSSLVLSITIQNN